MDGLARVGGSNSYKTDSQSVCSVAGRNNHIWPRSDFGGGLAYYATLSYCDNIVSFHKSDHIYYDFIDKLNSDDKTLC